MAEYDSAWKEAIDHRTEQVTALLFPDVGEDTDWTKEVEPLDAELQKLYPEGRAGKRLADKLLKVYSKTGDHRYLHYEIQGTPQDHFERRMFVYQYRGDDRFGLPVEALVVLADEDPKWRPTRYEVRLKRTRLVFKFRPVKLLDWVDRIDELLVNPNPMGLFVVAHLRSQQTRGDPDERARVKLGLIVNLLERKLDGEDLRLWYRLLDWLLDLPAELEKALWQELGRIDKEKHVPFVTFAERYGMEKGMEKGLEKGERIGERKGLLAGLETALELRFGAAGLELLPDLQRVDDVALLATILQTLKQATSLADVRKLLAPTNGTAS